MEETQAAISDSAPQLSMPAVQSFKCKTCGREFDNDRALQTHEIRSHRQFWTTKPGKKPARSRKVKAAKNAQYVKYRERYYAQGLNAKGQPYKRKPAAKRAWSGQRTACPICSKPFVKAYLSQHMRKQHGTTLTKFRNGQTPGRGNPRTTCPVCSKTFSNRPNMTLHLRTVHKRSIGEFQERGGRPLTQAPAPASEVVVEGLMSGGVRREYEEIARAKGQKQEGRAVMFCPVCGTNIHNVQTAVNFGE